MSTISAAAVRARETARQHGGPHGGEFGEQDKTDQGDGALATSGPYKQQEILAPPKAMFAALSKFTADPKVKTPPADVQNGCENAVLSGDWAYATDMYQAIRIRTGAHLDVLDDVDVEPRRAARMCKRGSRVTVAPWGVEVDGQRPPVQLNRWNRKSKAARAEKLFDTFTPVGEPQMVKCDELDGPADLDEDAVRAEYEQARQAAKVSYNMCDEEGVAAQRRVQDRLKAAEQAMDHVGQHQIGDRWYPRSQLANARTAMSGLGYRAVEVSHNDKGVLRIRGGRPAIGDDGVLRIASGRPDIVGGAEIIIMPARNPV